MLEPIELSKRYGDVRPLDRLSFTVEPGELFVAALEEARRRGPATIAMAGHDGGRVAAEAPVDHVVVTRSQHIPRIHQAQAGACHVLRELVEGA